jgi:hypothetical protein
MHQNFAHRLPFPDIENAVLSSASREGAGWRKMILRLPHCRLTAAEIADRLGISSSWEDRH